MDIPSPICPHCHQPVAAEFYFCPNCGTPLREGEASVTVLTQIGLYALSIFLPPLGLWPGIKYARKNNVKEKRVGLIVIALTIISTVLTLWGIFALFNVYVNSITQALNSTGL
jgi:hypothetical protein